MRVDYENVKHLIMEGEIDKALDQLVIETYGTDNEMEVAMLSSRHKRLQKGIMNGTMEKDDIRLEENQISASLFDFIGRLKEDFLTKQIVFLPVQLFETAVDNIPEEFTHTITFPKEKTRCIGWALGMTFPIIPAQFDISLEWFILADGQPIMPKQTATFKLETSWDQAQYTDLWGAEEFGLWDLGIYTLEVYCKSNRVSTINFTVT